MDQDISTDFLLGVVFYGKLIVESWFIRNTNDHRYEQHGNAVVSP